MPSKVKELVALFHADGWRLVRQMGSHRKYHHASKSGMVTLAGKGSVEVPPWTLNSVLKQAGLKKWCVAVGATRAEVTGLIHEAIEIHLEGMKEDGIPIPEPHSTGELVQVHA